MRLSLRLYVTSCAAAIALARVVGASSLGNESAFLSSIQQAAAAAAAAGPAPVSAAARPSVLPRRRSTYRTQGPLRKKKSTSINDDPMLWVQETVIANVAGPSSWFVRQFDINGDGEVAGYEFFESVLPQRVLRLVQQLTNSPWSGFFGAAIMCAHTLNSVLQSNSGAGQNLMGAVSILLLAHQAVVALRAEDAQGNALVLGPSLQAQ